jgi:hypothetical protein
MNYLELEKLLQETCPKTENWWIQIGETENFFPKQIPGWIKFTICFLPVEGKIKAYLGSSYASATSEDLVKEWDWLKESEVPSKYIIEGGLIADRCGGSPAIYKEFDSLNELVRYVKKRKFTKIKIEE